MQLFEALVLMAGINLPDGRPLAGEVEAMFTDANCWSDRVEFKDGSYIAVNMFNCFYAPGTSNKVFSRLGVSCVSGFINDKIGVEKTVEEAFRELCFKVAEIY